MRKRRGKSAALEGLETEVEAQARWAEVAPLVAKLRGLERLAQLEQQRSDLEHRLSLPGAFFLDGGSGLETLARLEAESLALSRTLGLEAK